MCDSSSTSTAKFKTDRAFHIQQHIQWIAQARTVTVPTAVIAQPQGGERAQFTTTQGATWRIPPNVRGAATIQPPVAPLPKTALSPGKINQPIRYQAWGREKACRPDLNQLSVSLFRSHRVGSAASRLGRAELTNTVESWKSSGFDVSESRPSIFDESVDIGARANPFGLYPIVFPFHGHSLSSFHQQRQSAGRYTSSMSLLVRGLGGHHQHVSQGCIYSDPVHHDSVKVMHISDYFNPARDPMPTTNEVYRDRSFSSNGRVQKCGGRHTRDTLIGIGSSKAEQRAAARVAAAASVVAASAKLVSARAKAEEESGNVFDAERRRVVRAKGEKRYNVQHPTARSMIKSSKGTEVRFPGAWVTESITPPVAQWWDRWAYGSCLGGSLSFPHEIGAGSGEVSFQEIGNFEDGGRLIPLAGKDDTSSSINGVTCKTSQLESKALPVAPLNTLRSDDQIYKEDDESTLLFPHDTSSLCGLDGRGSITCILEGGDRKVEKNCPSLKCGNEYPLRSNTKRKIFDVGDTEGRGFSSPLKNEQENVSSRRVHDCLDAGAHEFTSRNNCSFNVQSRSSTIATKNTDVSRTAPCSSEQTLELRIRALQVARQKEGRPKDSPMYSQAPETTAQDIGESSTKVFLSQVSTPSAASEIVQPCSPPLSIQYTHEIQQQHPLESLPSWAHYPPELELDTGSSLSRIVCSKEHTPQARRGHCRGSDIAERSISNIREAGARLARTHVSMATETLSTTRSTSLICREEDCETSNVGKSRVAGFRRNVGGERNTEWCTVYRREGLERSKAAMCSFPGCRQKWAWENKSTVEEKEPSTRCCVQHKYDRMLQIRELDQELDQVLELGERTAANLRRSKKRRGWEVHLSSSPDVDG